MYLNIEIEIDYNDSKFILSKLKGEIFKGEYDFETLPLGLNNIFKKDHCKNVAYSLILSEVASSMLD